MNALFDPHPRSRWWMYPIAYACVLAMAIVAVLPIFRADGWPQSHDAFRYFIWVDLFRDAIDHGVWYPRVLPDLFGGYGAPLFAVYQPGFFYAMGALSWLDLPIADQFAVGVALFFFVGGLGALHLCRFLAGGDLVWGVFGAFLFLITPYVFCNLYVRGDLSELLGMLLTPWPMFWLLRLSAKVHQGRGTVLSVCGFVVFTAAMVYSHPAPVIALIPGLCVLALVLSIGRKYWLALMSRFVLALYAAMALSCPYWLVMLQSRPLRFGMNEDEYLRPELHVLWPGQLVSNHWGFGISTPYVPNDVMPFQLGAVHLLLAIAGVIAAWSSDRRRVVLTAFAGYAVLIFLMLHYARPFWYRAGFLRSMEFPWRFLSSTAALQLVALMGLYPFAARRMKKGVQCLVLAAVALVAVFWYRHQYQMPPTMNAQAVVQRFHELTKHQNLYEGFYTGLLPKHVRIHPSSPRRFDQFPIVLKDHVDAGLVQLEVLEGSTKYRLRAEVTHEKPVELLIAQLYFPGWQVRVNGIPIDTEILESGLTPHGMMQLRLEEGGTHLIEAAYEGYPGSAWRLGAMALAILLVVCLFIYEETVRRTPDRLYPIGMPVQPHGGESDPS